MFGSSLQRRELLPHLLSRPCKRRLKTVFKTDFGKGEIFRSSQVKRCIEESRSALRSLKTWNVTDSSVARVSRSTRQGIT